MRGAVPHEELWECKWCGICGDASASIEQACLACRKPRGLPVWVDEDAKLSIESFEDLLRCGQFGEVAEALTLGKVSSAMNRQMRDVMRVALAAELENLDVYLYPSEESGGTSSDMGWRWPDSPIVGGVMLYLRGDNAHRRYLVPRRARRGRAINLIIKQFNCADDQLEIALVASIDDGLVTATRRKVSVSEGDQVR